MKTYLYRVSMKYTTWNEYDKTRELDLVLNISAESLSKAIENGRSKAISSGYRVVYDSLKAEKI